jgi:hypothetical protein
MQKVSSLTAQRWRALLDQHRASGLSIVAFCRRHELAVATFHFWKRRLLHQQDAPAFIEVRTTPQPEVRAVVDAPVPDRGGFELRLRRGVRLRVGRGFDRQLLNELIDTLERRA